MIVVKKNVSGGSDQHCCKSPMVSHSVISASCRNCQGHATLTFRKPIFPVQALSDSVPLPLPTVLPHKHTKSSPYHVSPGTRSVSSRKEEISTDKLSDLMATQHEGHWIRTQSCCLSVLIIPYWNTSETDSLCSVKLCLMILAALSKIPFFS